MVNNDSVIPRLDIKSLPGPETIVRHQLANGIIILVRENFASPSVVFSGFIPGGSYGEKREEAGRADLAISCLMRGSKKRDFQAIYESIESIGASLALGTGKHTTSFYGKGLSEDLETLIELLSEVLQVPAFPEDQLERLKAEKLTSLALRNQNTGAMAQLAFNDLAYPEHPYCIPTDGFSESVSSISVQDLKKFHQSHVGPKGMVVAVVGAVPAERVIQGFQDLLGSWENPHQSAVPEIQPMSIPEKALRKDVALAGKVQSDLVVGIPGPSRFDPGYLAGALGNNILGRFGMYGRMGDRVREAAGLAYYAYSSLSGGPGPGAWQVVAGVNPSNVELAIALIQDEIGKFAKERVTEEELTDNQANFIGRLPIQLETNEGVARALIHLERYQLGLDYYQRYPTIIAEITRDEILAVAKRFLDPKRLIVAVAGPDLQVK
jgi:zinc protease